MKKLLASSLIALAGPLALVTPAGAAVPKKRPTLTVACPAGQDGEVRVWRSKTKKGRLTQVAVDNPCDWYVSFPGGEGTMYVAPDTHFHWSQKRIRMAQEAGLPVMPSLVVGFTDDIICADDEVKSIVRRYDDVQFAC